MAEESGGDGWWGAWGTELLANVKAKSAETLSLVKHDLAEFVTTIQHDTTVTVAETAHNVKEKLKVDEDETDGSTTAVFRQGVSQWLGSISTALQENVSQMSAIVDEEPMNNQPGPVFDRAQAIVHEIQTNPATYCNDPDGHPANYEDWCRGFDLEHHKADISELLVNQPEIRSLYTKLVPAAVTHALFWTRYFYKMHRFEQEEKRKAALVERASKVDEEEIGWDDEEESWDVGEISSKEHEPTCPQSETADDELEQTAASSSQLKQQDQEEKEDKNTNQVDIVETRNIVTETKSKEPNESMIAEIKQQHDSIVKKETEPSLQTGIQDVEKSTGSSVLPSALKEQINVTVTEEGPRDFSTPEPCTAGEHQQTLSKHKRTTSDASGGKDELHRENDSNSSVDSSWSKLSDEDLKQNNDKKTSLGRPDPSRAMSGPSPSQSEISSSSVVVVPSIDDKDVDWDEDDDFDIENDVDKDDSKKGDAEPIDDDDDDWENWE